MAIASVQSNSAVGKVRAFGSNVTAGDLLVVGYGETNAAGGGATVSDSLGTSYSLIKYSSSGSSTNWAYLWVGTAPSSGANTVTVTSSGDTFQVILIAEFSGCSANLETFTTANTTSGYKLSTATDGNLVLTFIGGNHTALTFSGTSTTVLVQNAGDGTHDSAGLGWQIGTNAGVQVTDMAESGGHTDNAVIVASFLVSISLSPSKGAARQSNAAVAQTVAFLANVVSGNLLVVCFGTNTVGTPSMSDSLGTSYTYLGTVGSGVNAGHFWYGTAPSSGANTITISSSWTFPNLAVAELINAGAIDVSATSNAASGYAVTTTSAKDLLITGICSNHTNTFTVGTGCAILSRTTSGDTIGLSYQNGGNTAGSETSGLTGANTDNAAFFVGFKVFLPASPTVFVTDRLDIRDGISLTGPPPNYFFLLGDALNNLADSARAVPAIVKSFSDTVNNLVDALSRGVTIPIQAFDSNQFNWGDALSQKLLGFLSRTASDALSFSDLALIVKGNVVISVTAADTLNLLADAIRLFRILKVVAGDNLVLSDIVMVRFANLLKVAEAIPGFIDFALTSKTSRPAFNDSVNNLSDVVSFQLAAQLTAQKSDGLSLTDHVVLLLNGVYSDADYLSRIRRYLGDTQSS